MKPDHGQSCNLAIKSSLPCRSELQGLCQTSCCIFRRQHLRSITFESPHPDCQLLPNFRLLWGNRTRAPLWQHSGSREMADCFAGRKLFRPPGLCPQETGADRECRTVFSDRAFVLLIVKLGKRFLYRNVGKGLPWWSSG